MASSRSFDQAAAAYDRFMGRWSRLFVPSLIEGIGLAAGDRVLDVAAGSGEASLACLRAVGPGGMVVASDISVPMLAVARRKAGGVRVSVVASSGQALAFRAGSFDAVLCVLGLMFFPEALAGLREFNRALVPRGRLALSVWPALERVPLVSVMVEAFAAHLPDERRAVEQAFSLAAEAHLAGLLQRAGFSELSIWAERRRLTFESFGGLPGHSRPTGSGRSAG